jgi:hypothetical protein
MKDGLVKQSEPMSLLTRISVRASFCGVRRRGPAPVRLCPLSRSLRGVSSQTCRSGRAQRQGAKRGNAEGQRREEGRRQEQRRSTRRRNQDHPST